MTEITKEYINMRNSRILNVSWFRKYFIESTGKNVDHGAISMYLSFVDHNDVFNHLDKKFNLDTLYDKNGSFLMCYPGSN